MRKSIYRYEGKYDITDDGIVISLNYNNTGTEKELKQRFNRSGRAYVNLCINGKYNSHLIHRLVAETFIPTEDSTLEVNHIDGEKKNNHLENLEWISREENIKHGVSNNLFPLEFKNAKCKLSDVKVREIREKYIPFKYTMSMLAQEYNVSKKLICDIINFKRRKKVK